MARVPGGVVGGVVGGAVVGRRGGHGAILVAAILVAPIIVAPCAGQVLAPRAMSGQVARPRAVVTVNSSARFTAVQT